MRIALLAVLALGCQNASQKTADSSGAAGETFTPLFNGKDLSGWVTVLDSPWTVENGILTARQNPQGRLEGESWLITEKSYRNFTLRLQYRITPGGNSGVFLHDPLPPAERIAAPQGGVPPWDAGYEANINNDEPNYPSGSIWALAKGAKGLQREGEWNSMQIRVDDNRVWTWVNGKPAVDGFALPPRPRDASTGTIGLQRHGTAQYRDKVIEFKEIEIAVKE